VHSSFDSYLNKVKLDERNYNQIGKQFEKQNLHELVNSTTKIDSMDSTKKYEVFQAQTHLRMESLLFRIDKIYNLKSSNQGEGIR